MSGRDSHRSSVVGDEVSTVAVGVRCSLSHAHTHNTVLAVSVWLFGLVGVVVLLFLRSFVRSFLRSVTSACCCAAVVCLLCSPFVARNGRCAFARSSVQLAFAVEVWGRDMRSRREDRHNNQMLSRLLAWFSQCVLDALRVLRGSVAVVGDLLCDSAAETSTHRRARACVCGSTLSSTVKQVSDETAPRHFQRHLRHVRPCRL